MSNASHAITVTNAALFRQAVADYEAGRLEAAQAGYFRILDADPTHVDSLYNVGKILGERGWPEQAVTLFRLAVRVAPAHLDAHLNLGRTLYHLGQRDEAVASYREALRLAPKLTAARIGICMAMLPILYTAESDIPTARAAYATALAELAATRATDPAIGDIPPFFLAYQGQSDRDLQAVYGHLLTNAMEVTYPTWTVAPDVSPPQAGEPIRVGILSAYFHDHSNWRIPIRGWLTGLDRARFQLFGYSLGRIADDQTAVAAALCHRFTTGPMLLEQWAETIRDDRLHVLLVPGIGMDPLTGKLAALRLAPVQATSLGHPDTTGLPAIDHYLSSDLMEPAGAEAHYTEQLVRLPNLSVWLEPPTALPASVTRAEIGLTDAHVLYWCCQGLYKYLPQYDWIFPRIAAAVPQARFVFIRYPMGDDVTLAFQIRLAAAFVAAGLNAEQHCVFLPFMERDRFAGVTRLADVFLDSIGWSGFNTALEALAANVPVITVAGQLMRGRHGAAILTRLQMPDLIAADPAGLVDLAIALGKSPARRQALAGRIARDKHRLYRDQDCVNGLARYLETAASSARA